jgi:hypothetical protein
MRDDDAPACCNPNCRELFGLLVWRHHCRGCGRIFCDECCPDAEPARICTPCNSTAEDEPEPLKASSASYSSRGGVIKKETKDKNEKQERIRARAAEKEQRAVDKAAAKEAAKEAEQAARRAAALASNRRGSYTHEEGRKTLFPGEAAAAAAAAAADAADVADATVDRAAACVAVAAAMYAAREHAAVHDAAAGAEEAVREGVRERLQAAEQAAKGAAERVAGLLRQRAAAAQRRGSYAHEEGRKRLFPMEAAAAAAAAAADAADAADAAVEGAAAFAALAVAAAAVRWQQQQLAQPVQSAGEGLVQSALEFFGIDDFDGGGAGGAKSRAESWG